MATPAKKWPHNAEWCRCDCIALARKGRAVLLGTLDAVNDPATLRSIAKAINDFREIEAKLVSVGAKAKQEVITHE